MWLRHVSGVSVFAVSKPLASLKGTFDSLEVDDALQRQVPGQMAQLAIPETAELREAVDPLQFVTHYSVWRNAQSDDDSTHRPLKIHSDNQRHGRVDLHPGRDLACVPFRTIAD
jgi:hypothetical protein